MTKPTHSSNFTRPYDGRSTYPIDDETLAGLEKAVCERREQRQAQARAEHERLARAAAVMEKHGAAKAPPSEADAGALRELILAQQADAARAAVPIDPRQRRGYRKHPIMTLHGSCVDEGPRYGGSESWTSYFGANVQLPPADPQDGILGGSVSSVVAGDGSVFVGAGIWFFTQDACGRMDARCDFVTNGREHWGTIGGWVHLEYTLGLTVYGDDGNGWGPVLDASQAVSNHTEYIGFGSRPYEAESTQVAGSVPIHQNSLYYIEGWSKLRIDVVGLLIFGSGGGGAELLTGLSNIHVCV
jgi:hypothetical protein